MIYATGIVFVSLIGKGLITGGPRAGEGRDVFSTVPESMFWLFLIMNGNQNIVGSLVDPEPVKFVFITFMVVSNWLLLSILTAVISDHMIASSERTHREDSETSAR